MHGSEGPEAGSRDAVVLLMRGLHDRGLPRDVVEVYLAGRYHSVIELENLGGGDPLGLRDRLEGVVWISDEEFAALGLAPQDIAELRRWALDWEADLGLRILEEYDEEYDEECGGSPGAEC